MNNRSRSYRRHQQERRKARARRTIETAWSLNGLDVTDRMIGLFATTPKMCSSWCCGNPRKWYGKPTIQERRNQEAGA